MGEGAQAWPTHKAIATLRQKGEENCLRVILLFKTKFSKPINKRDLYFDEV
jgi:uncharacterized protein YeaC (DUF1315 family)